MMEIKNTRLQVTNLECMRNQRRLFHSLSFELNEGELLLILGENGSGKSSLLRLLTGFATPAAGEIKWSGLPIKNNYQDYTKNLHYLGHVNGVKSQLTIQENLELIRHHALANNQTIPEALQFDPVKNLFAHHVSAGQKRRLALAKLFLLPRKLWILDEPLTALDANSQSFFLSELKKHLQQGGMAVISTHQSIELENMPVKKLRLE